MMTSTGNPSHPVLRTPNHWTKVGLIVPDCAFQFPSFYLPPFCSTVPNLSYIFQGPILKLWTARVVPSTFEAKT